MNQENREPPQSDSENSTLQKADQAPVTPAIPADQPEATDPKSNGEEAQNQYHISNWRRFKKWLFKIDVAEVGMLVLTLVIAGSSIAYTRYAKRQWKLMRESNEINRESLVSVQRAFVTFEGIELNTTLPSKEPGKRTWVFASYFENSGTTPAVDKIGYFNTSNEMLGEPPEEQFIGHDVDRQIGEIGPKSRKQFGKIITSDEFILGDYPLSSIETEEFRSFFRSKRIFFWGWAAYRDVFTNPHVTEFCEEVDGITATPALSPIKNETTLIPKLHFMECEQYNCTDEHCKDYQTLVAMIPK